VDHNRESRRPLSNHGQPADTNDMRNHLRTIAALAFACGLTAACDALKKTTDTPTAPTPGAISLDAFAGTWVTSRSATPTTGCGAVKYTVTPVSATSANVAFSATCASTIQVVGTGTGRVNGAALEWSAQGTVSQGGVNCPFTFPNGRATEETGGLKLVYSGTVCGIPVSGEEVLKKP
jgi:hypothetical protein